MTRVAAVFLFALQIAVLAGPPPQTASDADRNDYRDGSLAAVSDTAKGIFKYEIIGLWPPYAEDLARQAKDRYAITVIFHGCVAGPRVWYDQGYLDIVVQRLIERYGFDPVKRLDKELMEQRSSEQ